jgi:AbrB family looped-hinge helix DNA binding protein
MYAATVSSKYQVVIPRQVRQEFGIKPGSKLAFIPFKKTLRVVIVPPIEEAEGFLRGIDAHIERQEEDRI